MRPSSPKPTPTYLSNSLEGVAHILHVGDVHGHEVMLNGAPLRLTSAGELPLIRPLKLDAPLVLPPASIAFVHGVTGLAACGGARVEGG